MKYFLNASVKMNPAMVGWVLAMRCLNKLEIWPVARRMLIIQAALYDEFQKIRTYKSTVLEVDPTGFGVETSGEADYREVKIDLPDSWVRGFLQVNSAMTLPSIILIYIRWIFTIFALCCAAAKKNRVHGVCAICFGR